MIKNAIVQERHVGISSYRGFSLKRLYMIRYIAKAQKKGNEAVATW
jgi:hypothetical protein